MKGSHSGGLHGANMLRARRMGIDALHETIVFMRKECAVCRSEGFNAHARVRLSRADRSVIATLYHVTPPRALGLGCADRPGEPFDADPGFR
jgi:hypothetical protein